MDEGIILDIEEVHEQLNGNKFYAHVIKTPLYDLTGELKGILGFFWDITESKKAEEELIRAKNKAEISEQMKSAFLAQMSHEIRSPLYRILGYVSLIKDYVENPMDHDSQEALDYFESIDLSSKRLIRTIDSILNMSEIQTKSYNAKFSLVDMYEVLNNLYREYLIQAAVKNLNFELTVLSKNTRIYCDEYSVTQIFANLMVFCAVFPKSPVSFHTFSTSLSEIPELFAIAFTTRGRHCDAFCNQISWRT